MVSSALVLFDIDGTLLRRAGPHHREALERAVLAVTGLTVSTVNVPVAGMLDRDIISAMLRESGLSATRVRSAMPEIVARAQSYYVRSCPDLRRRVCPGARQLLRRLQQKSVPTGLVTGNLTRIGWRKMEQARLRPYLQFGAFAEMAKDRTGLVRLAIRHARREGWIAKDAVIALLGDHPNDIGAARANGIRSIAVATGALGADVLAGHRPDILVSDMRALSLEMLIG